MGCYNLLGQKVLYVDTMIYKSEAFKQHALFIGYTFNQSDEINSRKSHIFEIGIWKSNFSEYRHPVNITWYAANDFVLHNSKLGIGPKVGGYIGFWGISFGGEIIYYTDFKTDAFYVAPYFGLGTNIGKITIKPYIKIKNQAFDYVNNFGLSLSLQILNIKKVKLIE